MAMYASTYAQYFCAAQRCVDKASAQLHVVLHRSAVAVAARAEVSPASARSSIPLSRCRSRHVLYATFRFAGLKLMLHGASSLCASDQQSCTQYRRLAVCRSKSILVLLRAAP